MHPPASVKLWQKALQLKEASWYDMDRISYGRPRFPDGYLRSETDQAGGGGATRAAIPTGGGYKCNRGGL